MGAMSTITLKEIEKYIDNEVKEGRVTIGFEDVNGELLDHNYIYKRMVSGFMLIKSQFSPRIRSEPIFAVGEHNDILYEVAENEKLIGTIPSAPCYAVFCLVPENEPFAKVKSKPHVLKSVLLGFEYPLCEHPDWIECYKKEFVNSFKAEKLRSVKKSNTEREPSLSIEDIIAKYEDKHT